MIFKKKPNPNQPGACGGVANAGLRYYYYAGAWRMQGCVTIIYYSTVVHGNRSAHHIL